MCLYQDIEMTIIVMAIHIPTYTHTIIQYIAIRYWISKTGVTITTGSGPLVQYFSDLCFFTSYMYHNQTRMRVKVTRLQNRMNDNNSEYQNQKSIELIPK